MMPQAPKTSSRGRVFWVADMNGGAAKIRAPSVTQTQPAESFKPPAGIDLAYWLGVMTGSGMGVVEGWVLLEGSEPMPPPV
jgi:hypothetical protein